MLSIHHQFLSAVLTTARLWLKKITTEIINTIYTTLSEEDVIAFLGFYSLEELQIERRKFSKGLATHKISIKKFSYYR